MWFMANVIHGSLTKVRATKVDDKVHGERLSNRYE